ncbi:MAG: hypothetical protein ACERLM_12740 [Acidimicrobiales bacterium]
MLAQCHEADPHAAWLSLGPAHNDPVVLWWALIESIREVLVGFGEAYRHRLLVAGTSVLDEIVESYGIDYRRSLTDVIAANTEIDAADLPSNVFLLADDAEELDTAEPDATEPDAAAPDAEESDRRSPPADRDRPRHRDGDRRRPRPGRR